MKTLNILDAFWFRPIHYRHCTWTNSDEQNPFDEVHPTQCPVMLKLIWEGCAWDEICGLLNVTNVALAMGYLLLWLFAVYWFSQIPV